MKHIKISDVTMKQPETSTSLSFKEKIELAKLLDKLGVNVIELEGFHNSKVDALRIKSIASAVKDSIVAVPVALTAENIFEEMMKASETMDDAEVPETNRVWVVSPATYTLMKKSPDIVMDTDVGQDMRLKGVIAHMDGAAVCKVPSVRLPEKFGFMLVHPSATVAPVKLEDYTVHENPPGISGSLVEGRVCYDAFVLENKKKGIYYQATT
jgi:hypothetical protein